MAQYPRTTTFDAAASTPKRARPLFWLRLASYGWNKPISTVEQREKVRRSILMAWVLLGLYAVTIAVLPLGLADPATLASVLAADVLLVVATVLNRAGWTIAAGTLVVATVTGAIFSSLVSQPGGRLPLDALPAYDLLAMTVIIAATVLPRSSAFIVAAINSVLIALDFFLQPHALDIIHDLPPNVGPVESALALISRPIALQIILAVMAYVWVRSTDNAIRRADRAEEIASLEHSLADQKRQLDIGIQQILQTHIRVANGDYTARTPLSQDNVLWQIAVSLNNLLSRIQRSNQAEFALQRTYEEIGHIVAALDDLQAGRRPIWPTPTGTAADPLLERLVHAFNVTSAPPRAPNSQPQSQPNSQPLPQGFGQPRDPGSYGGFPPLQPPLPAPYSGPNPYQGVPPFGGPGPQSGSVGMPMPRAPHAGPSFPASDFSSHGSGSSSSQSNPWAFPLDDEDPR